LFTGIVQNMGRIAAREDHAGGDCSLRVTAEGFTANELTLGESISVCGACLTATRFEGDGFWADVSGETLDCTTLGSFKVGTAVNLEKALTVKAALDGHIVSGHVDGVATLESATDDARSRRLRFALPRELAAYVAPKGSVCLDGVSLTVNDVGEHDFGVNIVPHTLEVTTLGELEPGRPVNMEVDIVARYLERILAVRGTVSGA